MTLLQADTKSYKRFKTQIVDVVNGETLFMFQGHPSRDLAFGVARLDCGTLLIRDLLNATTLHNIETRLRDDVIQQI